MNRQSSLPGYMGTLVVLASSAIASPGSSQELLVCTSIGRIYRIDNYTTSPTATLVVDTGLLGLLDIAVHPETGQVVCPVAANGSFGRDLYTIDLASGGATYLVSAPEAINGLEYSSDGELYGRGVSGDVFEFDPAGGTATVVATGGLGSGGDLAFDLDGTFLGLDAQRNLDRTDLSTGVTTSLGSLGAVLGFGLEVDLNGAVFLCEEAGGWYSVDRSQGTTSLIGDLGIPGISTFQHFVGGCSFTLTHGEDSGSADCDCTSGQNPCFSASGPGRGCPNSNTNGLGARLVGEGSAVMSNDTFRLSVTDAAPGKLGLILAGSSSLGPDGNGSLANSAGVLCAGGSTRRGDVVFTSSTGAATFTDFNGAPFGASDLAIPGTPLTYTFWFRDPGTASGCLGDDAGSDFNFSNGWTVTWY